MVVKKLDNNNERRRIAPRWKKGCPSPNPSGRPPTRVFSEAAKAILAEVHPRLQKSGAERLMEMAFRRALQGSYKHLALLLGYAEGRPAQSINVSGSMVHGYAIYRDPKLAKLTPEELKQLDMLTRKLLAPEVEKTLEITPEAPQIGLESADAENHREGLG